MVCFPVVEDVPLADYELPLSRAEILQDGKCILYMCVYIVHCTLVEEEGREEGGRRGGRRRN